MVQWPAPYVALSDSTAAPTLNLNATTEAGGFTKPPPLGKTACAPCNPTAPFIPHVDTGSVATTVSKEEADAGLPAADGRKNPSWVSTPARLNGMQTDVPIKNDRPSIARTRRVF